MAENRCQSCHGTDNLFVNSKRVSKNGDVVCNYLCRKCNTERAKKYRQTENGRKAIYKAVYKSVKKYNYKQNARVRVYDAIKKGKITRPDKCDKCKTETKPEAHHKDYLKPLDVSWLCKSCHCLEHKKHKI